MAVTLTHRPRRRARIRRIASRIAYGLLAVLILAIGGGAWWLYSGVPDTVASRTVTDLAAPVQILYDRQGIPHIFAANEADAFFALGYAHARDRLFQMDLQRRIGQGRLAEIVGSSGLPFDRFMRVIGAYHLAEESFRHLAPEVQATLESYAAGVNAWLADPDGPLPPEFALLRYSPEPWRPADSLVWGKLMAVQLSGNMRTELLRARLAQRLAPERLEDLFPGRPAGAPVTLGGLDAGSAAALDRLAAALPPPLGPATASNEWALAGSRTATGRPILANDPHLGLGTPILWYLARIETPELSLAGATTPGVPLMILGHNDAIAWGFTTTGTDAEDLFLERLDPDDQTRYLVPGGSEPFTLRQEVIQVRGGDPVTLTVRSTRHGPVLSDIDPDAAAAAGPGQVAALAFTALTPEDTTAEAIWRLNRATDWTQFRAALSAWIAPQQNVVYADAAGNIGLMTPGRIPIRPRARGDLPVEGWTGQDDWRGFVPFDELPQRLNPASGLIVNANNPVVGPDYPYPISSDVEDDARARRITEVLDGPDKATVDGSAALQLDIVSLDARDLLPDMLAVEVDSARAADAVARLRRWDFAMDRSRPEPLIFEAWLAFLGRALTGDELGDLADAYGAPRAAVIRHMLRDAPAWCNDVTTPAVEGCGEILKASLDRALDWLAARYGDNMDRWRWGDAHIAPLAHQVFSRIPLVSGWLDNSIATSGGADTVNRADFSFDPDAAIPFADVHGAGYRAVYDLSNLENSRFMIATGQSGHPLSRHYGDLVRRWRDGDMLTLSGTPPQLLASGGGSVTLRPAR